MFAPSVFSRGDGGGSAAHYHKVHHQPTTEEDLETARAALAACPVAAIRTETNAQKSHRGDVDRFTPPEEAMASQLAINPKFNGRPPPFPRPVSQHFEGVYFVGHHNEDTFGAAPYLLQTQQYGWILIDTPKFNKSAREAVETLTGPDGPSYMVLTHVDDTAGHDDWSRCYPSMKRILHAGDLGVHNWRKYSTLEDVEVILHDETTTDNGNLQYFDLNGKPLSTIDGHEVVLVHTPGHSPGSICLWRSSSSSSSSQTVGSNLGGGSSSAGDGILFTGDTYAWTTKHHRDAHGGDGHMTGFPRYGNNLALQVQVLKMLRGELFKDCRLIAPGHGHVRDYSSDATTSKMTATDSLIAEELEPTLAELLP